MTEQQIQIESNGERTGESIEEIHSPSPRRRMSNDNSNILLRSKSSMPPVAHTAIQISNVHKRYRRIKHIVTVLNGLNIKKCYVRKTYVLYGAVKSGKSTLVRLIVNISRSDHGAMTFWGNERNELAVRDSLRFGYMPQRLGLDDYLSIEETVRYFGTLKGMDLPNILASMQQLKTSLSISDLDKKVAYMQEHQKRILSFYIATMGSLDILVLDEPTSGCDPIYKHYVWSHLKLLVANNEMAVLMTTSDQAECMNADIMGYLRNGKILAEDSPEVLFKKFNVKNIDQVLYCIAVADFRTPATVQDQSESFSSIESGGFTFVDTRDELPTYMDTTRNDSSCHKRSAMSQRCNYFSSTFAKRLLTGFTSSLAPQQKSVQKRLQTLLSWNCLYMCRNVTKLSMHTILPILALVMYYFSVNGYIEPAELAIVGKMMRSGFGCSNSSINNTPLCAIIDLIDDASINKHYFNTTDEAMEFGRSQRIDGILQAIDKRDRIFDPIQERAAFNLSLDISSRVISSTISNQIQKAFDKYNDKRMDAPEVRPLVPSIPKLRIVEEPLFSGGESDEARLIWGCVAVVIHFGGTLLGALPLIASGESELFDRLKVLGVTEQEIQLVHWITRITFAVLQNLLIEFCVLYLINDSFTYRHVFIGLLIIMSQTATGFAYGIFLYLILKNGVSIMIAAVVTEVAAACICGFFWHTGTMSATFKSLCKWVPHFAVAESLHATIIKDMHFSSSYVWPGIVVPLVWMFIKYFLFMVLYGFCTK